MTIGSFEWAKGEIANISEQFNSYVSRAETEGLTVREITGKENLNFLLDNLYEALAALKNIGKEESVTYEDALALYESIQKNLY